MLVERREIVRMVSPGQDCGVNPWVQGLHAPAEELGDLGQGLDPRGLDPVLLEIVGGAAAGDELDAKVGEPLRELGEAFLFERGEQARLITRSARAQPWGAAGAAAWTRARRVATVSPSSTGTGTAAITGPVSTPSST